MIIDFHAHVPPDRSQWPLFIEECRSNAVTGAVVSSLGDRGWPAFPDAAQVRAANEHARCFAEFANSNGLNCRWFVYVNPLLDNALAEMERGLDRGAAGVKLWISLERSPGDAGPCHPILAAARGRCPVLIHTFNRTGGPRPGEITIEGFAELARRFPQVRMVAAHAGGNWRLSLGALEGLPNAAVDVCGGFPETGMVEALVQDLGPDRVLFGSDMLGRSLASQLAKVLLSGLTPPEKEAVLAGNARQWLGAEPAPGGASAAGPKPGPQGRKQLKPPGTIPPSLPDAAEEHFCFCGRWPFAPDLSRTVSELARAAAACGIRRAYAASLDALCAGDPRPANRAFKQAAKRFPHLFPLAVVNPAATNALRVLAEAVEAEFAGVLVSPYHHAWPLNDPAFRPFWNACAEQRLGVWITADFGDHRFRPTGVGWRPVNNEELRAFALAAPANQYVFQGLAAPAVRTLLAVKNPNGARFRCEISRLTDYTGHLAAVTAEFGSARLVFGSEFPLRHMGEVRWTTSPEVWKN